MSLSVRTRFEVFKRDRFTCAYCGNHPPDVLLEVDHIVPRSAGGSDEMSNLVTACWDCNRGKSDRLLDEGKPATRADVSEIAERVEQARAYAELTGALRQLEEEARWQVIAAWARAFRADVHEDENGISYTFDHGFRFPSDASIRRILRRLPLAEVLDAVDVTASRFTWAYGATERYFYGVCWRKIDLREGRSR